MEEVQQQSPQSALDTLKKAALATGERTRSAIFVEQTHNGQMTFSYFGNVSDAILALYHMQRFIDREMDKFVTTKPVAGNPA